MSEVHFEISGETFHPNHNTFSIDNHQTQEKEENF